MFNIRYISSDLVAMKLLNRLITMSDDKVHNMFKVLIIGDSGVGKSSLLLRYADNKFPLKHQITIGVDFKIRTIKINDEHIKLQIWDTAGQERFRLITNSYYRGAHGVILVYDVTSMKSFQHVKRWLKEIQVNCTTGEVCKLLVGNKNDNPQLKMVPPRDAKAVADMHGMEFIESSAKECYNVEKVFTTIAKQILKQQLKEEGKEWTYAVEESIIISSDPRVENIKLQGPCC
ncbi:AAEL008029-PA [Aedes aegypti]|uniref:Ras-related protein, putative n=2 Tax=Aedes aegypti TaxID=7159 RepID=A0A8W7HR86_AEDAE|nr:ras-related protein Rab-35 isoform X2 [Aedes aegypti]XP_021704642.1 ras-related protein Rab-35 isoform X3 [Aedes aegypti]EAT40223.1 AAEL008029-PA [Aedes aegypti]